MAMNILAVSGVSYLTIMEICIIYNKSSCNVFVHHMVILHEYRVISYLGRSKY